MSANDILAELTEMRRADAERREREIPPDEMVRRAKGAAPAHDFAAAFTATKPPNHPTT